MDKDGSGLQNKLSEYIHEKNCTLLAVGPVSVNCVDAAIEISNQYQIPMMMIASRRQIDSEAHGGGYVNGWTTRQFSDYVKTKDQIGNVILARDHGGPWQNPLEVQRNDSIDKAMTSAKASYRADIDAGFNILHIDPSIDIHEKPDLNIILDRVFELYEYCSIYAAEKNRQVLFEVGTEEQSGLVETTEDLEYLLSRIKEFCREKELPLPMFVVVQIGTRVMETKNIGLLEKAMNTPESNSHIYKNIPEIVQTCNRAGIRIKVHNGDYLSDEAISLHPELGIHAANVAPEFAVTETRALLNLLKEYSFVRLADRFLELSYKSGKWKKWILKDTDASDYERAVIAGHYVYSTEEFIGIKKEAVEHLKKHNIILDEILKQQIKKQIIRYLRGFKMVN